MTKKYRYKYISIIATGIITVISLTVVAGWFFNVHQLKMAIPSFPEMKFNTALAFTLLSGAILLRLINKFRKFCLLSYILTGLVGLFGVMAFLQVILGHDFGMDVLLIPDKSSLLNPAPGRTSPITGFCFVLMSVGFLLAGSIKRSYILIAQFLFHITTLFAVVALLGYLFGIPTFYNHSFSVSMAPHTAVGLFVLSSVGSFLNPSVGITGMLTGKMIGNLMARRLTSRIIIMMLLTSYLLILCHRHNWVSVELAIALFAIVFIIITLFFIYKTSAILNELDHNKEMAKENFRAVVDSAPNALVISDIKGNISLINNQAKKMFGYESEEVVGSKLEILMPERYRQQHTKKHANYFLSPRTRQFGPSFELYAIRKDGTEFPIEISLTPIKTDDGTVALASIVDITERKRSESIIKKQVIELQQKNKEMEQFTYIASHDLQEPLRTVTNYLQLIEEDYPEQVNGELSLHLSAVGSAINRMGVLVRSLLDYGRLGRNKILSLTDSGKVLNEVVADLNGLIKSTGTEIIVDDTLPILYAYETELRQMLQNLLNNAIKFRKKDTPPVIHTGYSKHDDHYEFYVKDNGIGIDPKYSERIFKMFQRLNKEEDFEGHGVGLANCKKISELHGGTIWVESEPGEGSTFKFTIALLKHEQGD